MISMLLPARGRPNNLKESVNSIFGLAKYPDNVEILARLDDCDPKLDQELAILKRPRIKVFVGPRLGYSKMYEYYNGLAARSIGEWLFLWNDDIEMKTLNWDTLLCDAPQFAIQFPRRDISKTTDYTLPVVGRPVYNAIGHLSRNAYCDAWISDFSAFAGTSVARDDIVFTHHRLNDETLKDQDDGGRAWRKFTESEQRILRRSDMDAVIAAPGYATRFDGWKIEEVFHPVDHIQLAVGEMSAKSVILRGRL